MGEALVEAAREAGIRITLLDTLYLHGGLTDAGYADPTLAQRRFTDGSVDAWIDRVGMLDATDGCRVGAAIHSVRAVDPAAIRDGRVLGRRRRCGRPRARVRTGRPRTRRAWPGMAALRPACSPTPAR